MRHDMSRREEVSLSERLLRGCGCRLCMGKVFSGENMHVLEKGTYVALGEFCCCHVDEDCTVEGGRYW
jgi:hypothetical protein